MMYIPLEPVPKPRMTQRDRWAQRPAVLRYRQYCDDLRMHWSLRYDTPREVPERLALRFYITMPVSWSKKKRLEMIGAPHQQRPDIDNLVKAFLDALCEDDSYVYAIKAEKYWSEEGGLEVEEY